MSRHTFPDQKLTEYLLSESHAVGKAKAKYFRTIGYNNTNSDQLKEALLLIAKSHEISKTIETRFGTKYIIDGELIILNGGKVLLRTIWVIESADDPPRFVTAYPV